MIARSSVIILKPRQRGFHLVTADIVAALSDLSQISSGVCHLLLQHTSASLSLIESYDSDVRRDMESWSNRQAPEKEPYYVHTCEGPDDIPAHLKCALFGVSLSIPVHQGRLALGTWQGIWLGEHRNHGGARHIAATLLGT